LPSPEELQVYTLVEVTDYQANNKPDIRVN
jgi:hypothetical protein